jgi:hypothetical protein
MQMESNIVKIERKLSPIKQKEKTKRLSRKKELKWIKHIINNVLREK